LRRRKPADIGGIGKRLDGPRERQQPRRLFGAEDIVGEPAEFRFELFNAANHPNWGLPNTSWSSTNPTTPGAAFTSKTVQLTASYAGTDITIPVEVVRPGNIPVAPLQIQALNDDDPCAQHYVAGSSQDFVVKNPRVLMSQAGFAYRWTVTGAAAQNATAPKLTISSLPARRTRVTINVTLTNSDGFQAKGALSFTTVALATGLREELRRLDCSVRWLKSINLWIPPNVPVEEAALRQDPEQLTRLEAQSRQLAAAAERVAASVKAARASLRASGANAGSSS